MVNVVVALLLTAVFRAARIGNGTDITSEADYFADIGDPGVQARVGRRSPSTDRLLARLETHVYVRCRHRACVAVHADRKELT